MGHTRTEQELSFFVYGLDIRDKDFPEVTYDNGITDHPSRWGGKLSTAKRYSNYQDAYYRMIGLYKELRTNGDDNLIKVSFGIMTLDKSYEVTELSTEERMSELLGKFAKDAEKW